ncbi:hypothetical protein EYF80_057185 [Liparis tanakae]|uniref:Uncharacterized protein n=1 Tax=Liparis tanakae TaxID=230148 RepID=A0A4Z2EVR9_9TELE|nr:hypothetical protein EYF80_057185 [Liparis tanakae]
MESAVCDVPERLKSPGLPTRSPLTARRAKARRRPAERDSTREEEEAAAARPVLAASGSSSGEF